MREEKAESSALVKRGPGRYINEMRTLHQKTLVCIFPLLTS